MKKPKMSNLLMKTTQATILEETMIFHLIERTSPDTKMNRCVIMAMRTLAKIRGEEFREVMDLTMETKKM